MNVIFIILLSVFLFSDICHFSCYIILDLKAFASRLHCTDYCYYSTELIFNHSIQAASSKTEKSLLQVYNINNEQTLLQLNVHQRGVTSKPRQMKENYITRKKRKKERKGITLSKCQPFILSCFLFSWQELKNITSSVAFLLLFMDQFKTLLS